MTDRLYALGLMAAYKLPWVSMPAYRTAVGIGCHIRWYDEYSMAFDADGRCFSSHCGDEQFASREFAREYPVLACGARIDDR